MINVLIAEDNVNLSIKLSNSINSTKEVSGVTIINDGPKVFPTIKNLKPEIVVLDLKLPGEDGITILERIENDPELEGIKIIVYSGEQSYIQKLLGFTCVTRFLKKGKEYCEDVGLEVQNIAKSMLEKDIGRKINIVMGNLGFSEHLKGTKLLKECVEISIRDKEENLNVLYDKVAIRKNQTSNSVKTDIQRAVKKMWKYANKEKVRRILRLTDKETASPKNVIPMIVYHVQR